MTEIATDPAPPAPERLRAERTGQRRAGLARGGARASASREAGRGPGGAQRTGRPPAASRARRRRSGGSRPSSPPRSSASGRRSRRSHAAGRHDLGDQVLVEDEVVRVALVRDRLEQAPRVGPEARVVLRQAQPEGRRSRAPVRNRLETNFQLGMPPASGSPRNRLPSIRSASPARIGRDQLPGCGSRRTGSRGGA